MKVLLLREARPSQNTKTKNVIPVLKAGMEFKVEMLWTTPQGIFMCRCDGGRFLLDLPCNSTLRITDKSEAPQFGSDAAKLFYFTHKEGDII